MLFNIKHMRTWWPLATLIATLTLAGCSDDDRKGIITPSTGSGEVFHGAEWATIKNLDPRGEQCIDCHGKSADMSPNGKLAHNIGLQKHTDHSAYADLAITSVKVNETSGEVTVTLNKNLPADAGNLSMTFAKLAPRVIHNRGHDWQNYFNSNATGRGGNEPKASFMPNGGVQPVTVPNPVINGKTITFNLNSGEGRSFGEHDFTVESAYATDTDTWTYQSVKGTKFSAAGWDISKHVYCNQAYAGSASGNNDAASPANQLADENSNRPVCWWPDGTHLTSGVFATKNNEFIVAYEPDYTHRVTLILGSARGNPGFNTWFDFVPSVANGTKTPAQISVTDTANSVTYDAADYIKPNTGEVIPASYQYNTAGRGLPDSNATGNYNLNSETAFHQKLPAARDVVDVQSCNSCHDGLTMHGGSGRSQTQTCVTCHNPGNLQASSGRSVDFKQLIHRLHRGVDLPSEQTADTKDKAGETVKAIAGLMNDHSLVSETATDFTKVRFPQGPRPGNPDGITNCVKCHMGSETLAMVQGLADELGVNSNYNVQKELKLALATPQGDNWLGVRSVNACQACHDSNIWLSGGGSISAPNSIRNPDTLGTLKDPNDPMYQLDKYMPFYTEKYSDTGFDWLGKKLTGTATGGGGPQPAGWIHNTGAADDGSRFTCGSGGGCHGNNNIAGLDSKLLGDAKNVAIQRVHLRLTKDFIIAERFDIKVKDVNVDATGFHVKAELIDKKFGTTIADPSNYSDLNLGNLSITANAMFGWMANGSPDYNQSAGGGFGSSLTGANITSGGQPGAPAGLKALTFDSSGEGTLTITWDEINTASGNSYDFSKDFDKATSFGTVAINASLQATSTDTPPVVTNYRLRSATQDFSFADGMLAEGEVARRQVVDFNAGSGIDENRDRYAGWDKEHGSNTQSCSSCHLKFDMHGATVSNNTQMCVICHNPNLTDLRSRTKDANGMVALGADGQYEESEDFKRLIHAAHAAANFRIDPLQTRLNQRPSPEGANTQGHSFPGALSNCKACHVETEPGSGTWTFELNQLPAGQIGSTMITGDWATVPFAAKGTQHNLDNHLKMTPIASVCSSCHDAGYKGGDDKVRTSANILDGGPYIGSHWWVMGGIAPGIVRPGELPSITKHQSGL